MRVIGGQSIARKGHPIHTENVTISRKLPWEQKCSSVVADEFPNFLAFFKGCWRLCFFLLVSVVLRDRSSVVIKEIEREVDEL